MQAEKPRDLNILQVVPQLEIGGAEFVAAYLASSFAKHGVVSLIAFRGGRLKDYLENQDIKILIFENRFLSALRVLKRSMTKFVSLIRNPEEHFPDLVRSVTLPAQTKQFASPLYRFYKKEFQSWIQQTPYDVIHFHTISCAPLFCIAKQLGASVVYGHHNLIRQRHTKEDIKSLVAELKWVDKVVCVSKIAAEDFINATNIQSSKVVSIYNPSFLTEEDDRSFSGEHHREKGYLVAGTASNLEGPKGIDVLLQAWQKLRKDGIDARLMIAGGREPYLSYWRKQSVEMGLSECVFFLGQIEDKSKMFDFYRSIDFLIIPSRSEAFSLQVVEAMSRSLAVLASDIPVLREVLGDSGCFFQVEDAQDLADKVKVFVQSPEILADLGKAARSRWRDRYHPKMIIVEYEYLYQTLVTKRKK